MVSALDEKMLSLNEAILECLKQQKNGCEVDRPTQRRKKENDLDYKEQLELL